MDKIKIYLDCKLQTTFYDNMEIWASKNYIEFPKSQKSQKRKIKAFGTLRIRTPPSLVIFCYEFMNPTRKLLDLHVHFYKWLGVEEFEKTDFTKNIKPEYVEGLTDNERNSSI